MANETAMKLAFIKKKARLKKCPFCGSRELVRIHYLPMPHITCNSCWSKTGHYDTVEKSIKAWNRRSRCIEEARQAIDVPGVNLNPYREREQSIERIEALKTKSEPGEGKGDEHMSESASKNLKGNGAIKNG